MSDAIHSV